MPKETVSKQREIVLGSSYCAVMEKYCRFEHRYASNGTRMLQPSVKVVLRQVAFENRSFEQSRAPGLGQKSLYFVGSQVGLKKPQPSPLPQSLISVAAKFTRYQPRLFIMSSVNLERTKRPLLSGFIKSFPTHARSRCEPWLPALPSSSKSKPPSVGQLKCVLAKSKRAGIVIE